MLQLIQSFVIFSCYCCCVLSLEWTWIAVFVFVWTDSVGDVLCGLLVIELDFICIELVVWLTFERGKKGIVVHFVHRAAMELKYGFVPVYCTPSSFLQCLKQLPHKGSFTYNVTLLVGRLRFCYDSKNEKIF